MTFVTLCEGCGRMSSWPESFPTRDPAICYECLHDMAMREHREDAAFLVTSIVMVVVLVVVSLLRRCRT